MTFLLNGKPVDALAMIVHKSVAHDVGKVWARKLKDVIPRALFEIAIQAVVGGKVVARESLSAMRKDVTAGLYGGHYERKLKVVPLPLNLLRTLVLTTVHVGNFSI